MVFIIITFIVDNEDFTVNNVLLGIVCRLQANKDGLQYSYVDISFLL